MVTCSPCNACTGEGSHLANQRKPSNCEDCTSERLVKSGMFSIEAGKRNCSCYPNHKDNTPQKLTDIDTILGENTSENKEDDVKES